MEFFHFEISKTLLVRYIVEMNLQISANFHQKVINTGKPSIDWDISHTIAFVSDAFILIRQSFVEVWKFCRECKTLDQSWWGYGIFFAKYIKRNGYFANLPRGIARKSNKPRPRLSGFSLADWRNWLKWGIDWDDFDNNREASL